MSEPMIWLVGKRDGVMRWAVPLNQDIWKFAENIISVATSALYAMPSIQDLHWEIDHRDVGTLMNLLDWDRIEFKHNEAGIVEGSRNLHWFPVRFRQEPEGWFPEGREPGGIVTQDDETVVQTRPEVKAAEKSSHRTTHLLASYREIYTDTASGR